MTSMKKYRRGMAVMALFSLLLNGCVTRSLTIKTDPPGAMVYVNDQLKGKSPLTYDFVWYGWHRVMIRKEGFQRLDDRKKLRAPIYLWIPLDLVMELLPFRIRDARTWEYVLAPQTDKTPLPPEMFLKQEKPSVAPRKPEAAVEAAPPAAAPVEAVSAAQESVPAAEASPSAAVDVKAEVSAPPEKQEWAK